MTFPAVGSRRPTAPGITNLEDLTRQLEAQLRAPDRAGRRHALRGRLRKWLSCGCRRQPLPFGRRPASRLRRGSAHDVRLDQEVVSTTNHHKMFDVVAADEDDLSFSLDREGFDYCVATAQPFEHVLSPHTTKQCSLVIPHAWRSHIFSSRRTIRGLTGADTGSSEVAPMGIPGASRTKKSGCALL